jgi:hypothetical protein
MELDRERVGIGYAQTFTRTVVQVLVGGVGGGRQGGYVDGKSVILGGDFHATRLEVEHRLVESAMAELQLVGACSDSQRKNLMTQANAKNGLLS